VNTQAELKARIDHLHGRVEVLVLRLERAQHWRDRMAYALAEAQDELREIDMQIGFIYEEKWSIL